MDYGCFESYDWKLITEFENYVGPTQFWVFGLISSPCFHHSNSVWFEWEWWKPETPNWCFLFLSYITQWQECKILDLVEPTAYVLSCQLRPVLILSVQIQGWRPFLFLSSLKIFQPKFSPLSHFPLTFHYSSNRSTKWVWSHFFAPRSELKWVWNHFSVRCKDHLNTVLWIELALNQTGPNCPFVFCIYGSRYCCR